MPYTVQIPSYPDGSDILRGIPYKCCSGSDFFLILRMRRVRARSGHILMKVFSLLSSLENVAVFTNQGQRTALISCVDHGRGIAFARYFHIYSGVGYRVVYLIQVLLQPSNG